jgi:glutamate synthase (NADPH/NADH) large chain
LVTKRTLATVPAFLLAYPTRYCSKLPKATSVMGFPKAEPMALVMCFYRQIQQEREHCKQVIAEEIAAAGQTLIGWRALPTDPDGADVGKAARAAMPHFEQLFIGRGDSGDAQAFERTLYLIRKLSTHRLRGDDKLAQRHLFYVCSLSANVIIYKGMLTPDQLFPFYPDLQNSSYASHLAMVHSRFST